MASGLGVRIQMGVRADLKSKVKNITFVGTSVWNNETDTKPRMLKNESIFFLVFGTLSGAAVGKITDRLNISTPIKERF